MAVTLSANANPQYAGLESRGTVHYARALVTPYIYDPNTVIAIVASVVFALIACFSVYQYLRYRAWFFWTAMIGVIMYSAGFICRAISATEIHNDLPFLVSFLMILLAPSFLAAACYTAFSRVVWFSCPTHALSFKILWCFPRWITPTFVTFDLLSFLIQLVGGGIISRAYDHDDAPDRNIEKVEAEMMSGRVILALGLVLQLLCFASFAIISLRYFSISKQWRADDLGDWKLWRRLSWLINAAALLITVRAVYRTLEIPHDKGSGLKYLQSHEWCFWVFDALPIFATLVVMAVWHPGYYLPRSYTGLTLEKAKALREKDEIRSPSALGREGEELHVFRPEDFRTIEWGRQA